MECATCKREFTGLMQLQLARKFWRWGQTLPETDQNRLEICRALGAALVAHGKDAEAESLMRCELAVATRVFGHDNRVVLSGYVCLGSVLINKDSDNSVAEAKVIFKRCWEAFARLNGPTHETTLSAYNNFAEILRLQQQNDEAIAIFRAILAARTEALGPEHTRTLTSAQRVASTLIEQMKFDEADAAFVELIPTLRRVLGREHPLTSDATWEHAQCLGLSGQFA